MPFPWSSHCPAFHAMLVMVNPPPPAQNQYMQEKSWELLFARIHAGPVFALARIPKNIFEELFSTRTCQLLRTIHLGANTCTPVFAPARIQENFLANYLCIGFVPQGNEQLLLMLLARAIKQ